MREGRPAPGWACWQRLLTPPAKGAVVEGSVGTWPSWTPVPGVPGAATMRLNQNTLLLGKKVVLVPYTAEHVPRYHEWMKSEELQRLTASEPLTLEQEYAMQRSWREDADKCTFIVLDAERWRAQPGAAEESCMAGDVNLFLTDLGDPSSGEVEIMIAEPSCRGRGFGTEAVLMMMSYGVTKLGLTKFEAKIGQENEPSIRMFQKLHFEQVAVSSVFQEVTLRLTMSEPARQWLLEQTSHVEEKPYGDGSSEPRGLSPATRGVDAPGLGAEGSPPLSRLGVPFWGPSDSGSALSRPPSDWQCLQGSLPPGQA